MITLFAALNFCMLREPNQPKLMLLKAHFQLEEHWRPSLLGTNWLGDFWFR
jgi:hypothetical protein